MTAPTQLDHVAPQLPNAVHPNIGQSKELSDADARGLTIPRPEVEDLRDAWADARIVSFGYRAMLSDITRYLPKLPRERGPAYMRRVQHTSFTNFFGRAVSGMAALPFRRPLSYTNVPQTILDHFECVDATDRKLNVFLAHLFHDTLLTGCGGVLVEMPEVPANASMRDEERLGARPRWFQVRAEHLHRWRTTYLHGRQHLTMLALRFVEEEDDGEFATNIITRYRVYRLRDAGNGANVVTQQTYMEVEDPKNKKQTIAVPETDEVMLRNLTRIPFAPLRIGQHTSALTALTPLVDVLDQNLMHFRIASDRNWLMHLACMPIPVRIGDTIMPSAPIGQSQPHNSDPTVQSNIQLLQRRGRAAEEWGTHVMMRVPKDGDFKFAEITGSAFEPTGQELEAIKANIAALSLAFLSSDHRQAETAEANRLDAAVQNATITTAAEALDDCANLALSYHAEFIKLAVIGKGGTLSGGVIATSKEFEVAGLTAELGNLYASMEANRQISLETFWQLLNRLGALPPDFEPKKERQRLLNEANVTVTDDDPTPPNPDDTDPPTDDEPPRDDPTPPRED